MKITTHSLYFTSIIAVSVILVGGMFVSSAFSAPSSGSFSPEEIDEMEDYSVMWYPTNAQSGDTLEIILKLGSWETEPIIYRIISPIGNIVSVDQVVPDYNGYYTVSFQLDGKMFEKSGMYRVEISGATTHTILFEFENIQKPHVSEETAEISQPYNFKETTANQIQKDNSYRSGNELGFLGIIIIPIVIGIIIIIIRNNKKSQTPSSTVVSSQGENISDMDKQIAINEEKIRRIKEESKKLDEEDQT